MSAIGFVNFDQETGCYKGTLHTLTVRTGIEIVPNQDKASEKHPDFFVISENRTDLGAGWNAVGKISGKPYIGLRLTAPELGKTLYANLGRAAGQDDPDVYAIIWNPDA